MAMKPLQAAKLACEHSGWTLSNLSLQKILYLAQLVYMGRNGGSRLIEGTFEAWDYGPVLPPVYHKAKAFGSEPVENVFHSVEYPDENAEAEFLKEMVDDLKNKSPGFLVSVTHWKGGAWDKNYDPSVKGSIILDEDIFDEFRERTK